MNQFNKAGSKTQINDVILKFRVKVMVIFFKPAYFRIKIVFLIVTLTTFSNLLFKPCFITNRL